MLARLVSNQADPAHHEISAPAQRLANVLRGDIGDPFGDSRRSRRDDERTEEGQRRHSLEPARRPRRRRSEQGGTR